MRIGNILKEEETKDAQNNLTKYLQLMMRLV